MDPLDGPDDASSAIRSQRLRSTGRDPMPASTIYCTQLPPGQWHDWMDEQILARSDVGKITTHATAHSQLQRGSPLRPGWLTWIGTPAFSQRKVH